MKINKTIEFDFFYGAMPELFEKANALRREMTDAERILWNRLRGGKLGLKFRRQHPISEFIVDFYCHEIKLVIEVDGGIHDNEFNKEYDIERTKTLNKLGIKVIRFKNEDVVNDIEKVVREISLNLPHP